MALKPENDSPPDARVIQKMREHITRRWPGVSVTVLWIWNGGQRRFHFCWDADKQRHQRIHRPDADENRILCAMSYSGLVTAMEVLKDERKGKKS